MTPKTRTAATLAVLVAIMLIALTWGWQSLTQPLPQSSSVLACENTSVKAGETLQREMVSVTVLNASGTSGLAGKTMEALVARGFSPSVTGDAPSGTKAKGIEIWSSDPQNPAVELVRRQFRAATVVDRTAEEGDGVVVVVGKNPAKLKPGGPEEIKVTANATVCAPPIDS